MRRTNARRVLGSLLAIAALALAGTAYASGADSNGKSSDWHGHDRTIKLVEASEAVKPAFVDLGQPGPSAGDLVVVKDGLLRQDGSKAGVLRQACTLVDPGTSPLTSTLRVLRVVRADRGHDHRRGPVRALRAPAGRGRHRRDRRLQHRAGRGQHPRRGRPDHDPAGPIAAVRRRRAGPAISRWPDLATLGAGPSVVSEPETRYVKSADAHIAYQVVGDGPADLIVVRGYISHVEVAWESPALASFYRRLASFCRLILFDKRGTGLSDRVPEDRLPTLEQRMDDVRAVMEAVGSERAAFLGASEAGPMCLLFAATYPERTLGLLLWGCFAHYDWRQSFIGRYWGGDTVDDALDRLEREWGDGGDLAAMAPSVAGDEAARRAWGRAQRLAATPTAARALLRMMLDVDVRPLLPAIRVPVVILHRIGDVAVDVSHSRYMAERIPGSTLRRAARRGPSAVDRRRRAGDGRDPGAGDRNAARARARPRRGHRDVRRRAGEGPPRRGGAQLRRAVPR